MDDVISIVYRMVASACLLLVLASCKAGGPQGDTSQSLTATPSWILWQADHETGDLTQWFAYQNGAVYNSGTGSVKVTGEMARSGRYSLALSVRNAKSTDGPAQAARIFRWLENPKEAYYSAWYYFPERVKVREWWNIFQFKSVTADEENLPIWILVVGNLENGDMYLYLWDSINSRSYEEDHPHTLPTKRWVHLQVYVKRANDATGAIAVWQDSDKLIDLQGVQTAYNDNIQWSLNSYTHEIDPSNMMIYVDDAVISTKRITP
jgi:hypothetical protein